MIRNAHCSMISLLQGKKRFRKKDMMAIIMESLQYIRLESYKVPSRVENTLKRKNMSHISKFQFRDVCIQSKEDTNLSSNKYFAFFTHYLYPNNIVEE